MTSHSCCWCTNAQCSGSTCGWLYSAITWASLAKPSMSCWLARDSRSTTCSRTVLRHGAGKRDGGAAQGCTVLESSCNAVGARDAAVLAIRGYERLVRWGGRNWKGQAAGAETPL